MLYFALQQDIDLKKFSKWLDEHHISRWIYVGDDSTWRVKAETSIPGQIHRISLASDLDRKSWELREEYQTLIGEFSNINNSPEWWASELASKNPYTQLYTKICLLAASYPHIESSSSDTNIIFIASTPALKQELIAHAEKFSIEYRNIRIRGKDFLISSSAALAKTCLENILQRTPPLTAFGKTSGLYQKLLDTRIDYRRSILRENSIWDIPTFIDNNTILLFTWIDNRSFTPEGKYRDPHFGPLAHELKKRGYNVVLVPRILFTVPYRETVDRLLKTGEQCLFPEQCISDDDVLMCKRRSKQYRPNISKDIRIGPVPLFSLMSEQIENYEKILTENLQYEYFIKHLAKSGRCPRQIIHTCEGHSWELILKYSVQQYLPKTKVIGFDNVTFSRMVLSMFPAKNELNIRPIPDRIVTNGPMFYEVLKIEGLPPENIRSGCALRHTYLWEPAGDSPIKRDNRTGPIRILAATSVGLGASVELADKAAQAFGGNNSYEVLIKCHPMVDINQVKSFLGAQITYQNIHFVTEPMDKLLPTVDILLFTYTSICFEALRFGVYPVCVRSENFLNLDLLDAAPEIRGIATTPEEIRIEVTKFTQMPNNDRNQYKERSLAVLKQALAPVTDSCIDSFIV